MPQFQALEFGEGFGNILFRLTPEDHAAEIDARFAERDQVFPKA